MVTALFALSLLSSPAWSCGIEGTVKRPDGSKVNGTATVSTSWNGKKAVPRNGEYELELGSSACGASITVYVDGKKITSIKLPSSGNADLNIVVK